MYTMMTSFPDPAFELAHEQWRQYIKQEAALMRVKRGLDEIMPDLEVITPQVSGITKLIRQVLDLK